MHIFKKIAAPGKYQDENAIPYLVDYILLPYKTPHKVIGCNRVDPNDIAESMIAVSEKFGKNSRVRLHHFIVSLDRREHLPFDELRSLADMISLHLTDDFQLVYALHEDTENPHIHFIFNAVSYKDGHKYRGGINEYYALFDWVKLILSYHSSIPTIAVNYYPNPQNPDE